MRRNHGQKHAETWHCSRLRCASAHQMHTGIPCARACGHAKLRTPATGIGHVLYVVAAHPGRSRFATRRQRAANGRSRRDSALRCAGAREGFHSAPPCSRPVVLRDSKRPSAYCDVVRTVGSARSARVVPDAPRPREQHNLTALLLPRHGAPKQAAFGMVSRPAGHTRLLPRRMTTRQRIPDAGRPAGVERASSQQARKPAVARSACVAQSRAVPGEATPSYAGRPRPCS